jgi:hypothetical protein
MSSVLKKEIILIVLLCSSFFVAQAQVYPTISLNGTPSSQTQLNSARFEFVQSSDGSLSFLIDKYSGNVWRYKNNNFNEVMRYSIGQVDSTILNYQMYISGSGSNECFLINIHTGEMWRYGKNPYGDKAFLKLDMPWEDKNKNAVDYEQ